MVYTRPYRGSCNVLGLGEDSVTLLIPLKSPGREDCGVIKHDNLDTVVVDVRSHHAVEMITDRSFLVQCSSTRDSAVTKSVQPQISAALKLLKNDNIPDRTVVGDSYTVELLVPDGLRYTATSCLAFSAADDIQLALLSDRNGCPIGDVITSFFPVLDGSGRVRAEMVMFDFNNSHHFHIQCAVVRCTDLCRRPSCPDQSRSSGYAQLLSHKDPGSTITATRVNVLDDRHKLEDNTLQWDQCEVAPGSSTAALSLLLTILVLLTGTSCLSAWFNRPFRCQFNVAPRDTPYSFKHDFLRIIEEQITPPGTPRFSLLSSSVVQEAFRSTMSTLSSRRAKHSAVNMSLSPSALATSEYQNVKTVLSQSNVETSNGHRPSSYSLAKATNEEIKAQTEVKPAIPNEPSESLTVVQPQKQKPIPPPRKQSLRNSLREDTYSILPSPPSARSYMDTSEQFPPPPSRLEAVNMEKDDTVLVTVTNNHVKFDQQLTVYTEGLDEDDIERARSMASTYMTLNNRMTTSSVDRTDTVPREYPLMGVSALVNEPHKNVYWFYDV
uniref:ZP domain-containing protein n=1 Tax=Plectus sambesii TaxID=2011161 RepID=A0A914VTC0_9BILA